MCVSLFWAHVCCTVRVVVIAQSHKAAVGTFHFRACPEWHGHGPHSSDQNTQHSELLVVCFKIAVIFFCSVPLIGTAIIVCCSFICVLTVVVLYAMHTHKSYRTQRDIWVQMCVSAAAGGVRYSVSWTCTQKKPFWPIQLNKKTWHPERQY